MHFQSILWLGSIVYYQPFQEDVGPLCVVSRAVFVMAAEEEELQGPQVH